MMDINAIMAFLHGWILLLASFAVALGYAIFRGRQNLINLMMGGYLGLLLYELLPIRDEIVGKLGEGKQAAMGALAIFVIFTLLSTWLFTRLMPREFLEGAFETMGKKILLAVAVMVLVMTLSLHFLPVGEIISTGTPLPDSLQTEKLAYVWLILPLGVLLFI